MVISKNWCPKDGTVILTKDNFIMYIFGYDHPKNMVISYLKYIPQDLVNLFDIKFLDHKWKFRNIIMRRPIKLYSPKIFNNIMNTFKKEFPYYLYYSKNLNKEVIVVPYTKIKEIFDPQTQLKKLLSKKYKDSHEKMAIELIELLSKNSNVPMSSFGIHGSTSYEMHTLQSDIDIAVYGANNFLKVKNAIKSLINLGKLRYGIKIPTDEFRKNRGVFRGTDFVVNAIRADNEITNTYYTFKYEPKFSVKFECHIINSSESMFRPAKYVVADLKIYNSKINIETNSIKEIVSMIGEYRGIAEKCNKIKGQGMLEKVINLKTSHSHYRIVIGSGTGNEYILPDQ